jgi:hypothetical protein
MRFIGTFWFIPWIAIVLCLAAWVALALAACAPIPLGNCPSGKIVCVN